jgi:hypothetical protein
VEVPDIDFYTVAFGQYDGPTSDVQPPPHARRWLPNSSARPTCLERQVGGAYIAWIGASSIGPMRYEVSLAEWPATEPGSKAAVFEVLVAGQQYRRVVVVFPYAVEVLGLRVLGADKFSSSSLQRGLLRYAVRRVEDALSAGAIQADESGKAHVMETPADDESIRLIADLGRGDKTCSYQETEGPDLFCTAAGPKDETAVMVLNNGRWVAPTSRPLCAACDLPDTDYICSHFLHPLVIGLRTLGGPSSIKSRQVADGLCDLDQPEFAQHRECHVGGNHCWQRIVDVETVPSIEQVPAQAIEQALDDLEVRWRLAFSRSIVRLPAAEDVSVLALPSGSRDEFDRRLSSFANILKRLDIPDDLFAERDELPKKDVTLHRFERLFAERLAEDDLEPLLRATHVLRRINELRAGTQHSNQQDRLRAAEELGVNLDGRWAEAWERVRALAARALRDVGAAARRLTQ